MKSHVSMKANMQIDWFDRSVVVFAFLLQPLKEIYFGIKTKSIPWITCLNVSSISGLALAKGWDYWVIQQLGLGIFYPTHHYLFWPYWFGVLSSGFWGWGLWRTMARRRMLKRLTEVFTASGLRNPLGNLPSLVFDRPLDQYSRKLRVTRATFPKADFEKAIPNLESALQVYIDEVKEDRAKNTVDILYSHLSMPKQVPFKDEGKLYSGRFFVGRTRSRRVIERLADVPHLLIAGQTKGGKSTFLRQFITSVYINNPNYWLTLIDLKGGLEFQTFENLGRIRVIAGIREAISTLSGLEVELEKRKKLLKENRVKDIEAFFQKPKEKRTYLKGQEQPQSLSRHVVVIDEAFDLFMVGSFADAREVQRARRLASKIAAQGRAVGIHLVVATQRPDRNALDPQTKANLVGKLCFQMSNNASSMTVLDSGRASELPPVPGRAIWQQGSEMFEVQAPLMTESEAEKLLAAFKKNIPSKQESPMNVGAAIDNEWSNNEEQSS